MKGNDELIAVLNDLLANELTAISQYMVHSEMLETWGYAKLHAAIEKQAKEEMHHAESLIQRILFLEGTPVVSRLNPIRIGKTVPEIVLSDQQIELDAVRAYNNAVGKAAEVTDQSTADLLTGILKMEEQHLHWYEIQQIRIAQMALENYLATQV
jgi:bacterioferritin